MTNNNQTQQPVTTQKVVAKLTKTQYRRVLELRYLKDSSLQAMRDTVQAIYDAYERKKAALLVEEKNFWNNIYDEFDLDPNAPYGVDADNQTVVMHVAPEEEISEEVDPVEEATRRKQEDEEIQKELAATDAQESA